MTTKPSYSKVCNINEDYEIKVKALKGKGISFAQAVRDGIDQNYLQFFGDLPPKDVMDKVKDLVKGEK
jgi:hypothetical protein